MSPRTIRGLWPATAFIAPLLICAPAYAGGSDDALLIRKMSEFESVQSRGQVCEQILAGNPADYARHFCEGYSLILMGRDLEAELALNKSLEARPDFSMAARLYGDAYRDLGKPDLAETYYRRAIEIHPERTEARFSLGHLLFLRGQNEDPKYYPEALEAFRQMTETNPISPDGWSNMALVLTYMGRYQDAELMLRKAIDRDPSDPFLLDNLGALYARQNRDAEAEDSWRRALAVNPGYGPAVVELAALYARTGRLLEAVETLEEGRRAVSAPPWGPRIRRNLGFAFMRMEEWERSETYLREAAATGTDALAFLGLGHLQMLKGLTEAAIPEFERGATLDSTQAIPFVRAWKATLKFAIPEGRYPALQRAIGTIEAQESGTLKAELDPDDQAVRDGATGVKATPHLAAYVLEDWEFRDLDAVRDVLRAVSDDDIMVQYDTPPEPIETVAAEYPEAAQDTGQGGTVDIQVVVGETGEVEDTTIKNCNAPQSLCTAAERAARKWKFRPATRYGRPVRAAIIIPFKFTPAD